MHGFRFDRLDWRLVLFTLLAALLMLNAVFSRAPQIEGDGPEYFMMSRGLLVRGSPALHRQDLIALARAGSNVRFVEEALREPQLEWNGYYRTGSGKTYCYHYWLYSLINVPAFAAARMFGFDPLRSFPLTNSLLILLAAFVLLFKAPFPVWARAGVLLMFFSGGTTFYLDWTGPEVFSASLVLIGCTLLLAQRPLLAALAFAFPAQQNAPIGLLVAAMLAFWLWRSIAALRVGRISPRALLPQCLGAGLVVVFALQAPLFYWWNFGVPSLLTAHDFAASKFISVNRLLSFYFDLDQGLFRGAPFLLGALLVAFLTALVRRSTEALLVGLALVVLSIAMAVPSLTTQMWVAGCRVFLRYVYWGAVPLWFAAVYFLRDASPRWRGIVLGSALVCQTAWLVDIQRTNAHSANMLGHSWLSKAAIEKIPEYYNPDPYVFSIRTVRGWILPFQPAPGMIYYFEHPGRISKVLYHPDGRNNWIPECAATPAELETRPGVRRVAADLGWTYLNLGRACPLDNGTPVPTHWLSYSDRYQPLDAGGISFGRGGNMASHVWENQNGWKESEDWGTWTDGAAAQVAFLLAALPRPGMPLALTLEGIGRAAPGQTHSEADVYINGIAVGVARFARGVRTSVALTMPPELLARSSGIFHVRLQMRGPGVPAIGMIGLGVRAATGTAGAQ